MTSLKVLKLALTCDSLKTLLGFTWPWKSAVVTVFGVPGAVPDRSAVLTVDQLSVVRAVATEGSGVRAGPAITALTTGWLKRMLFLLMFFLRDEEVCEGTGEGGTWWRRRVGRVTQMLGVLLRV